MNRFSTNLTATIGTDAAGSSCIKFGEFAMGFFHLPSGSSVTSVTWYSCATEDGTYQAAYDEYGNAVTQTVSDDKAYAIPNSLAGAVFLKAVGDAEETGATWVLKA